jgi:hypothetical protein
MLLNNETDLCTWEKLRNVILEVLSSYVFILHSNDLWVMLNNFM